MTNLKCVEGTALERINDTQHLAVSADENELAIRAELQGRPVAFFILLQFECGERTLENKAIKKFTCIFLSEISMISKEMS